MNGLVNAHLISGLVINMIAIFDIAVTMVQCYIPSHKVISSLTKEKICTLQGHCDHLGNVTKIPKTNVRPRLRRIHIKFGFY